MNFKKFLQKEDEFKHFQINKVFSNGKVESIGSRAEIDELIQKECQPFLYESHGLFLYRGMPFRFTGGDNYIRVKANLTRGPRHSGFNFHDAFNKAFLKFYGEEDVRSRSTFATGSELDAAEYGEVHAIFPIGKFTYWWSPKINDSYVNFDTYVPDTFVNKSIDRVEKFVEFGEYQNTDLSKGLRKQNEIFVLTDEYYAIRSVIL